MHMLHCMRKPMLNLESAHQAGHFDIYVTAAGCRPVNTHYFVWASTSHWPVYVLGCYNDSVQMVTEYLYLGTGTHLPH